MPVAALCPYEPLSATRAGAKSKPSGRGTRVRLLIGWVLGGSFAAGACILTGVRARDLVRYVADASPRLVLVCMAASLVNAVLQAARWRAVMQPTVALRFGDAFCARVLAFLFNAVLPGRAGDLIRVQWLARRTGKSRSLLLATELVDRWLDCWGWIPLLLVICIAAHPPSWLYAALAILGGGLAGLAAVMMVLGRGRTGPTGHGRWARIAAALRLGIGAFRTPRTWGLALLVAPLPWLWESFTICWAAHAFGIELSFVQAFSVLVGLNVATLVPSPGGIGTLEAGGVAALVFCGVNQSQALAFMCLYHFTQLVPGVLGGALVVVARKGRVW
jgi:uncharacterized membrane protein YbhN (UPF0104 family)